MTSVFEKSTFLLSVAIFQYNQRMEFTFHTSYVILVITLKYSDFLDRARLLTQMLFKQGYVVISLKSSLQKLYSRHHLLVGRYKTSISQMTMDFFTFYAYVFFPWSLLRLLPDLTVYLIRRVSYQKKDLLTLRKHLSSLPVFWWGVCSSSF